MFLIKEINVEKLNYIMNHIMKNMFKENLTTTIRNYVNCQRNAWNLKNQLYNPYYWWWKVRKYWKYPKLHLAYIGRITWWYGLPCRKDYYNKYLDINLSGLGWKDYFNDPRFEWDPYLCFTFLRKWQIIFVWNFCPHFMKKGDPTQELSVSESTWETILDMANYGKNIADACHNSGFSKLYPSCPDKNYVIPPKYLNVFRNLTTYGLEQYYQVPRSKQLKNKKV